MKDKTKSILGIIIIIVLFLLASILTKTYEEQLKNSIAQGTIGMIIYVLLAIIATVIAPISTVPLLPVATTMWGWITAGILSIIGWWIGAMIAFYLSRKYGKPLIKKIINIKQIQKYEKIIPTKNIFLMIVWFRIFLPVDLLSYLLGLFSKVSLKIYSAATLIGIIPFAFILAYAGGLTIQQQILIILTGILIISINLVIIKKKFLLNNN